MNTSEELKNLTQITTKIPNPWIKAIRKHAIEHGTNFSSEVRIALSEYIQQENIPV